MTARFAASDDAEGFAIADRSRRGVFSDRIHVDARRAALTFTDFYDLPANEYYWLLPDKFLGNKVYHYFIYRPTVTEIRYKLPYSLKIIDSRV